MEELGGNEKFEDRFLAQHIAFFYYWIVVVLYAFSPAIAYNLNQHVEEHAYETYSEFIEKNKDYLKSQPAPQVAIDYYTNDSLFLNPIEYKLDQSSDRKTSLSNVSSESESKIMMKVIRPKSIDSLLDVFTHICADEAEHSVTMKTLQHKISLIDREKY
jgi:ubiquinol oxidase